MQPQSNYPGNGGNNPGSPQGGPVMPPVVGAPVPPRAASPLAPSSIPSPQPSEPQADHWVEDARRILAQSTMDPKSEADAIIDLKAKYQQKVFGLQLPGREGHS